MSQAISLVLPFPVSVNMAYRNVTGVGRAKTAAYRNWLAEADLAVLRVRGRVEGPYALHVEVDRPDKRRRDLSNLLKVIEDFCVSKGFVEDDSLCQRIRMEWCDPQPNRPGPCRVWLISTTGD